MRIAEAIPAIIDFLTFIKSVLNMLGITSLDENIDAAIAKVPNGLTARVFLSCFRHKICGRVQAPPHDYINIIPSKF